jgi:hypothetical protein
MFVLAGCLASWAAASRALFAWLASASFLAVYLLRGWALSGIGLRGLGPLLRAPFYLVWKLAALARGAGTWERTPREETPV